MKEIMDPMKRLAPGITLLTLVALALSACGGAAPAASQPAAPAAAAAATTGLDTSYEGALPLRNQLLLGTLRLEDSDQPLTAVQAAALLPLLQGLRGTMNSGASAQAEIDALLNQIQSGLTAEQIATIGGWKFTQADLQAWATSQGLAVGTGLGAGGGSGVPGSGQSLSPEARATRQAERGGAGESGGLSRALIDAVIALLESKGSN